MQVAPIYHLTRVQYRYVTTHDYYVQLSFTMTFSFKLYYVVTNATSQFKQIWRQIVSNMKFQRQLFYRKHLTLIYRYIHLTKITSENKSNLKEYLTKKSNRGAYFWAKVLKTCTRFERTEIHCNLINGISSSSLCILSIWVHIYHMKDRKECKLTAPSWTTYGQKHNNII